MRRAIQFISGGVDNMMWAVSLDTKFLVILPAIATV